MGFEVDDRAVVVPDFLSRVRVADHCFFNQPARVSAVHAGTLDITFDRPGVGVLSGNRGSFVPEDVVSLRGTCREPDEGMMWQRADRISCGDYLDLYSDPYADPGDDPDSCYEFECARVESVVRETPDCLLISTDNGAFGCPPEHGLMVRRES